MIAQAAGQARKQVEAQRRRTKTWHDIAGFAHTAFDNIFDKGRTYLKKWAR
jgi:hypothetical protein